MGLCTKARIFDMKMAYAERSRVIDSRCSVLIMIPDLDMKFSVRYK